MKVRVGWSTDYAKKKFDVEVEEPDLEVLLREEGLDGAPLTVAERFALMKTEADIYAAVAMHGHFPTTGPESPGALQAAAQGRKSKYLAAIRARLNGE